MRVPWVQSMVVAGILGGCSMQSAIKPAEMVDETTGVTVGTLKTPIELVENLRFAVLGDEKRSSFAFFGPVEWDTSGDLRYGLWLQIAPGNDKPVADIHEAGAVTLLLDDEPVVLTTMEAPRTGSSPYRSVAGWGQTSFFNVDVALLRRMAASHRLVLDLRPASGDVVIDFTPTHETSATLADFLRARGIDHD